MPYIELRNYTTPSVNLTLEQRDAVVGLTRDHLARGQEIDGTFEFHYLEHSSDLDKCEYDYLLVIDMGWSSEREQQKAALAKAMGKELASILNSTSFAVRLRLQNAAFVPYDEE